MPEVGQLRHQPDGLQWRTGESTNRFPVYGPGVISSNPLDNHPKHREKNTRRKPGYDIRDMSRQTVYIVLANARGNPSSKHTGALLLVLCILSKLHRSLPIQGESPSSLTAKVLYGKIWRRYAWSTCIYAAACVHGMLTTAFHTHGRPERWQIWPRIPELLGESHMVVSI